MYEVLIFLGGMVACPVLVLGGARGLDWLIERWRRRKDARRRQMLIFRARQYRRLIAGTPTPEDVREFHRWIALVEDEFGRVDPE